MSRDKWSDKQKERAALLFELCPKIKEAYDLTDSLRSVFRSKVTKEVASDKLHCWYKKVAECTLRELKSARDLIMYREEHIFNSKLKRFRAQLHGVSDYKFFIRL